MEPSEVKDYATVEYWNKRYSQEPSYDWFSSCYDECVAKLLDQIWERFVGVPAAAAAAAAAAEGETNNEISATSNSSPPSIKQKSVRVLHLGCGNSKLCHDLAAAWYARCSERLVGPDHHHQVDLFQVAVDYSDVVIENMCKGPQPVVGPPVEWVVCDCRNMSSIVPKNTDKDKDNSTTEATKEESTTQQHGEQQIIDERKGKDKEQQQPLFFDVVIDKGTMDALQADKESDTLDEDLDAFLKETSRVLRNNGGVFFQITWEHHVFRKHIVLKEEYGWQNDEYAVFKLNPDQSGDSLYRILRFVKM